jgi:hypothetical protein
MMKEILIAFAQGISAHSLLKSSLLIGKKKFPRMLRSVHLVVNKKSVEHSTQKSKINALLADPTARITGTARDRRRRLPLAHQPHDLPPRPIDSLLGRSVAALHYIRAQMRRQHRMSSHVAILYG